jgi:hypothetical protein
MFQRGFVPGAWLHSVASVSVLLLSLHHTDVDFRFSSPISFLRFSEFARNHSDPVSVPARTCAVAPPKCMANLIFDF